MFRPRVIPVLLLKKKGLVKTKYFKDPKYIGDPINAVRIFNDLNADELVFLDILATLENRTIDIDTVKNIGDEAFMPFAVGGGIKTTENIKEILNAGAEKVIINSAAAQNPEIITKAANKFGSQSIVVSIDVIKSKSGNYQQYLKSGTQKQNGDLFCYIKSLEKMGAGEILLTSIERDGSMKGYDYELIKSVAEMVNIPVIACGGAGNLDDLKKAVRQGNASAVGAGSLFVFHGPRNAVLINYPEKSVLETLFNYE